MPNTKRDKGRDKPELNYATAREALEPMHQEMIRLLAQSTERSLDALTVDANRAADEIKFWLRSAEATTSPLDEQAEFLAQEAAAITRLARSIRARLIVCAPANQAQFRAATQHLRAGQVNADAEPTARQLIGRVQKSLSSAFIVLDRAFLCTMKRKEINGVSSLEEMRLIDDLRAVLKDVDASQGAVNRYREAMARKEDAE
jgi:tRNA splicing endonuclease